MGHGRTANTHTHSMEGQNLRWKVKSNLGYPNNGAQTADFTLPTYSASFPDVEVEGATIGKLMLAPGPGIGSVWPVGASFAGAQDNGPQLRRNVTWHQVFERGITTESHLPTYYKLAFIMKL